MKRGEIWWADLGPTGRASRQVGARSSFGRATSSRLCCSRCSSSRSRPTWRVRIWPARDLPSGARIVRYRTRVDVEAVLAILASAPVLRGPDPSPREARNGRRDDPTSHSKEGD